MADKKKAVPPQNSQSHNLFNIVNYNEKTAIVKNYRAHRAKYRDYIVGTYECVDDAFLYVLMLINQLEKQRQSVSFQSSENGFLSEHYAFSVYVAVDTIGYQGQNGFFSLIRRSASNVFLLLPVWLPPSDASEVIQCCVKVLYTQVGVAALLSVDGCNKCVLTAEESAEQIAYQQTKLKGAEFSKLALLTVLEKLLLSGVKVDLLPTLQHAIRLSDGFLSSYCNSKEVQYE